MTEPLKIIAWELTTDYGQLGRVTGRPTARGRFDLAGTIEIKWTRAGRRAFEKLMLEGCQRFEREIEPAVRRAILEVVERERRRTPKRAARRMRR